ncbi:MAG: cyclase family protein, partial [Caulobacterales bacterium]|nr:cyclase family protein [Caulobacterales bacterium]
RAGDIVILNLGWHARYSDSQEYFGEAPGLAKDAAEWLVSARVKMVGVDTPNIDHPLATLLGRHRKGPHMKRLPTHYQRTTGRDPGADFPDFAPAHKTLLAAGIPTIENVGGALDAVTGQRSTFHAMPWRWIEGDACVVRLVAIHDPGQSYRVPTGV